MWSWFRRRRGAPARDVPVTEDAAHDATPALRSDPSRAASDTGAAGGADDDSDAADDVDALAVPPLTDELDLHTFRPRDCGDVVTEYLHAAQEAGFARVRLIHGKGIGALRRTVHAVLAAHPAVASYRLADERSGSWGATLVELRPRAAPTPR